jgi:hypothetical protein
MSFMSIHVDLCQIMSISANLCYFMPFITFVTGLFQKLSKLSGEGGKEGSNMSLYAIGDSFAVWPKANIMVSKTSVLPIQS